MEALEQLELLVAGRTLTERLEDFTDADIDDDEAKKVLITVIAERAKELQANSRKYFEQSRANHDGDFEGWATEQLAQLGSHMLLTNELKSLES